MAWLPHNDLCFDLSKITKGDGSGSFESAHSPMSKVCLLDQFQELEIDRNEEMPSRNRIIAIERVGMRGMLGTIGFHDGV